MSNKTNLKPLVRRAMRGDAAAFEKLIERFSVDIVFRVSTQLDSKNDVQDVSQEVILALYNNIAKLSSPNAFYAYLRRIIANMCIAHNQKHGKLHQAADIGDYENEFEAEESEQPQEQFAKTELTDQVKQAIAKLPIKQREALYLYYYGDLSYKEIALVQGVGTNTVGSNINKAKAALKKMVEMQDANLDNQKLGFGGAISTPVLADAVSRSVGELAPSATFDSLPVYAHELIVGGGGSVAFAAAAKAFNSIAQRVVKSLLAVTITVSASVGLGYMLSNIEPASKTTMQYKSFVPEASIEFAGGNFPQNINPTSARALTSRGTIEAWTIVDQGYKTVLKGQGNSTGEVLASLPKGKYMINWRITSSTTDQSDPAVMHREFTVE